MAGRDKSERDIYLQANYTHGLYDTARTRITDARNLVRHRLVQEIKELEAQGIKPAFSSRPLAIVHQARAFADDAIVNYQVLPHEDSLEEDNATSYLESFLSGVKGELARTVGFPIADGFFNYFETGRAIWKMRFDSARACDGEFPFVVTAVDPYCYARLRGNRGLVFVVEKESKNVEVLCDELYGHQGHYDKESKRKYKGWKVPGELTELAKQKPNTEVELTYCYDHTYEWCFLTYMGVNEGGGTTPVTGQLLWKRPHYMGRIPFFEAFCVPLGSDRPEELGAGLVYPILSMLQQENLLFSKFANDAEIGSRPLAHMQRADGSVIVDQIYPGYQSEHQVKEWEAMVLQQNEVMLDKLMATAQNDVSRMTFPEVAFSGQIMQISGEAYKAALSGLAAKLKQFMTQPQVALGLMAGMLLERIEYFLTDEMAAKLAPNDKETYLESCSVALANGRGKNRGAVAIKAQDIGGHYRVDVTIEPSLPQDDNAKVERFVQVRGGGVDFETAIREYLQPSKPEAAIEGYWDEQLRQNFPEYNQLVLQKKLVEKLERDPELGAMYQKVTMDAVAAAEEQKAREMQMQQEQEMQMAMQGGMMGAPPMEAMMGGQPQAAPPMGGM